MLAEYDENSSLKTYYTRGEELISQERNGAKSYYLYDGFDSVRMLTDEDGTATDFYTYDAFGNLTEQVGDTENSYLYRGEQYDSFTGLYYLRARYMNPSTGTFITMDEYAGSVFEPVSLHKYLYANANPVMFSDPSGYSAEGTLSGQMTAIGVIGVLSAIIIPNYSQFVNAIGFLMTEIYDAFTITVDSIFEWSEGIASGVVTSPGIAESIKDKAKEKSTEGSLADVKKSRPRRNRRVYQFAYISSKGCLIRLGPKYTFWETLILLGVTEEISTFANKVYKSYDAGNSTAKQWIKTWAKDIDGKLVWGVYTHDQSDAKALAVAFGNNNRPDVHGLGMYGHYHDSRHQFHIWYGGQIN